MVKNAIAVRIKSTIKSYVLLAKIIPGIFICSISCALLITLQPLVTLFLSARILGELSSTQDVKRIGLYIGVIITANLSLSLFVAFFERRLEKKNETIVMTKIRLSIANHFAGIEFKYAEDGKTVETISNLENNMYITGQGLLGCYHNLMPLAQGLFGLILSSFLFVKVFLPPQGGDVFSSWPLYLLGFLMIIGLILTSLYQRREKKVMEHFMTEAAEVNTTGWYYEQYLGVECAAKEIRIYSQQPMLMAIFGKVYDTKKWIRLFSFIGRENGFSSAIQIVVSIAAYMLIGLRAVAGLYQLDDVVQYVGAISIFASSLSSFAFSIGKVKNNAEHVEPLQDFFKLPLEADTGHIEMEKMEEGVIEFNNVSFKYPGMEDYALSNICFRIKPGMRLAIVGQNGSGKSTLIKLLCALYKPTKGEILYNGVNICDLDTVSYRKIISTIFQDYTLFPLSLAENVAVSDEPNMKRVIECLSSADVDPQMITRSNAILSKAYDPNGIELSGGEEQKIAIARALYKNSKAYLMDEPTAALDPIAEHSIYKTTDNAIGGNTAVFVSHRLSSCRFCDHIIVLDNGCIVQHGSHDQLSIIKDGLYSKLWNAQAQYYTSGEEKFGEL